MTRRYLSIVAIARNEAAYIEEWIAFHQAVGVDHFYLYDNGSTDDTAARAERMARGHITVINWPGPRRQLEAYGDALAHYNDDDQWLAFIDVDEFLFSPDYAPVSLVLRDYETLPALGVCWAMFGTSDIDEPQPSVIGAYRMRARGDDPVHRHVKSILQPRLVPAHVPANPHCFRTKTFDTELRAVDGAFAETVTWQELRINHYWSKSIAEARIKERTPRADNGETRRGLCAPELNAVLDEWILPYRPLVKARLERG